MFCSDVSGKTSASFRDFEYFLAADPAIAKHCTMSMILGKRKRRTLKSVREGKRESSEESESPEVDAQELFRRHFEAKFKPLPVVKKAEKVVEIQEDESEEESDWDGISEDGQAVEVVEHTDTQSRTALMSKDELKAFMVWYRPSILKGFH